ncbi:fasciclin-like arabinogalactan protein 2 [Hibiscus syriacus]|uniref:fasciclin-like arabinogalactan protein 2 n=1 Tax=Hibiscus syriacus TaxID=106335 RepID=UPI001923A7CF|nr:fasciclin-like arabinogalactan protein 2 [Hibiscus syriacus]
MTRVSVNSWSPSRSLLVGNAHPTPYLNSNTKAILLHFQSHHHVAATNRHHLLLLSFTTTTNAHNITRILAKYPQFSTFNHYLTATHLASQINRRQTITVLALDNTAMSSLLSRHFSLYTLKNVLSLHVLVDYFGSKKLHRISKGTTLTSTMFQATGAAEGTSGYVNITNLKGGKVGFGAEDNDGKLNATYVKSVKEIPYNISIIQISHPLDSAEAEAPTAAPTDLNITEIMMKQGCKAFADLLKATDADETFNQNLDAGLTVFCPTDQVVKDFMPKYKNLTAAKKKSLLLYHGLPVYMNMQMLKTNTGIMNTLATDGANKFDFTVDKNDEVVMLDTTVVTAKITGIVKDEEPLIVYKISKVLLPKEMFKPVESANAPDADAPVDSEPADDQTLDDNNGVQRLGSKRLVMVVLSLCIRMVFM